MLVISSIAFLENSKSLSIAILDNSDIFSAWSDTLSISLTVLNNKSTLLLSSSLNDDFDSFNK